MKRNANRALAMLFAVVMILTVFPVMTSTAVAAEPEAVNYEDLYVKDGLTGLFTAYGDEAADNLDLASGVWKNRVGTANATVTGGAYNGTVGWSKADKGFYYDLTRANFWTYRNTYGVMLPLSLLTDNDHALELVFDYRGLDGVNMAEDADGYGLRACSRSTINFGGFHMSQFHASNGSLAAGLESRFHYAPSAFENGVGEYNPVNTGGHLATYLSVWMFSENKSHTEFVNKSYTISINRNTSWRGESGDYRYVAHTVYLNNAMQLHMDNHSYIVTCENEGYGPRRTQIGNGAGDIGVKYDRMYHTIADLTTAWAADDAVPGGTPFEAFYGMPATVYAVRIYNRTLSVPERNQNHFADLCAYHGNAVDLATFSTLTETMKDYVYTLCAEIDFTAGVDGVNAAIATAKAKNVSLTAYDELYVQNGLVMLLSAYGSDTASADIAGGVWYNKAANGAQNAIISSSTTADCTGWAVLPGGKGGIGYEISAHTTASKNTYIDLSGVVDGTGAYTVEYTGTMANGVAGKHDTNAVNNKLGHWGDWFIDSGECMRTLYNETDLNTNYFNCKGMVGQSKYIEQSGISTFSNVITNAPEYSTRSVYVNTVQNYSQKNQEFWGNPTQKLNDSTPSFFLFREMDATVYAIRVYDRELTAEERTQNHAVDLMAYFGLDVSNLAAASDETKAGIFQAFSQFAFEASDAEIAAMQYALNAIPTAEGFQVSKDGTALRVWASAKTFETVADLGMKVIFKQDGVQVGGGQNTTKTAFSSIIANETEITAASKGVAGFYAASVSDVPAGTYTVEVTPYVVLQDGNVLYGTTQSQEITFD